MWQLIKQFPLPNDLRDGIIYCQRSLRDFVLQHQNLASKINKLPKHQRAKVKQFMLELESEIIEIGQEQEALVRTLSQRLKVFRVYVQQKTNVNIPEDVANGYVSRVLQTHNDSVGHILPLNCTKRLSAHELSQKYCLENITKLEKFLDDDNANFAPWIPTPHDEQRTAGKVKKSDLPYIRVPAVSTSCSSSSSSPSPVTPVASRSLLKPKQERVRPEQQPLDENDGKQPGKGGLSASREPRAFASIRESADRRSPSSEGEVVKVVSVKDESCNEDATADAPAKKQTVAKQSTGQPQIYPRPGGIWMPGLRGRPPKGVKYIPASKLANVQAAQRQIHLRKMRQMMGVPQRGRPRKIRPEISDTPPSPATEPEHEPEPDSPEEQPTPASFGRPSAAVRRGRSNLQLALNRLKRPMPGDEDAETFIQTTALEIAKKSKPSSGGSKLGKHHGSSGSSGSSPSSRSCTPTLSIGRLAASDDSSDRRCDAPLDSPPSAEPEAPPPNDIWELGMKALLNYFGLCTPDEAKARRERRQERKRRSCYSTERKDFHYGRLDYYEQQQLQAATRTSKRPHQRPVLYSPPVAAVKKRKHQQQQQQQQQSHLRASGNVGLTGTIPARQRLPMRCMSLDSRDIFAAMSNRRCFVCNKTGSTLELSACTNCCNIYHISCHSSSEAEDDTQLFRHRDNLCPVCLGAEDDGEK